MGTQGNFLREQGPLPERPSVFLSFHPSVSHRSFCQYVSSSYNLVILIHHLSVSQSGNPVSVFLICFFDHLSIFHPPVSPSTSLVYLSISFRCLLFDRDGSRGECRGCAPHPRPRPPRDDLRLSKISSILQERKT